MNKEQDIKQIEQVLKYLHEGWSVTVAAKKAGLTPKEYKYLRDTYPNFKVVVEVHYKRGTVPW